MPIISCPGCGASVSTDDAKCPICNYDPLETDRCEFCGEHYHDCWCDEEDTRLDDDGQPDEITEWQDYDPGC